MEVVIASSNLHKIRELRDMLKALSWNADLLSLLQFPSYEAPPEDGASFEENAKNKALCAAKALQRWVIADDSGLVVPALNGLPGVNSRRYAGHDSTEAENRYKLLAAMQHLQGVERSAYFECCLALVSPDGSLVKHVRGSCEGMILTEERGRGGFGYDSIFVKNEYDKTFAEMGEMTKNRISHRRKALEKLMPSLESL